MTQRQKVRFAVVGLGHIAQIAVLPAFKHAQDFCELTALISDDKQKIDEMTREYKEFGIKQSFSYDQYDEALRSGVFDAVYIALPNDMHLDFARRAAAAGIHILCEKPMAMSEDEFRQMVDAARNKVKLMIAYRLHFEKTNMHAVDLIEAGRIGTPRLFNTTFSMQVREGNIRTQSEHGGGPLMDIGIYCINAARYLFKSEPIEVTALSAASTDPRFREVEESFAAVLRFPGERLATFNCSFGAADVSTYQVVGTRGSITLDPAYDYALSLEMKVKSDDKVEHVKTPKRDQFAPELIHFAQCVINDETPNPDGREGLMDLRIIDALRQSAKTKQTICLPEPELVDRPDASLVIEKPGVPKPKLVNVVSGSK